MTVDYACRPRHWEISDAAIIAAIGKIPVPRPHEGGDDFRRYGVPLNKPMIRLADGIYSPEEWIRKAHGPHTAAPHRRGGPARRAHGTPHPR